MTWKCEYCDSYNDINVRYCYVCCQAQPREYTDTTIYGKIYKTLRIVVTTVIVLAICMIGIQFFLKIKNGDITDVNHMYKMLIDRLSNHDIEGANVISHLFSRLWDIIENNLFKNVMSLWRLIVNNVNAVLD